MEHNNNSKSEFIGFDTFWGLPDAWGEFDKGAFSTEGRLPAINDPRCCFVKGSFQETLVNTLPRIDFRRKTVVHLDADLYTSTLYVLMLLANKFKKDDIIIFDEFGSPLHEFRAFSDFIQTMNFRYTVLGYTHCYSSVAMKFV